MAWIRTVDESDATGDLAQLYEEALARAGRVYNIVKVMSVNPPVLKAMLELYKTVMFGPSSLSRRQREMLAVVVSSVNHCHY